MSYIKNISIRCTDTDLKEIEQLMYILRTDNRSKAIRNAIIIANQTIKKGDY